VRARRRGGSRDFFRQVLIVVLGVLVALALEHLLSEWRERQRVSDTLLSMNEELSDFGLVFAIRAAASDCITGKLDEIDALLRAGRADAPAANIGRAPISSRAAAPGTAARPISSPAISAPIASAPMARPIRAWRNMPPYRSASRTIGRPS
jgi:hypothetical protein